jgi:hypothetical protein
VREGPAAGDEDRVVYQARVMSACCLIQARIAGIPAPVDDIAGITVVNGFGS